MKPTKYLLTMGMTAMTLTTAPFLNGCEEGMEGDDADGGDQTFDDATVTTTQHALTDRYCRAYYMADFLSDHALPSESLQLGTFHARGSCGSTVPNKCRERARDRAMACMESHWAEDWRPGVPSGCDSDYINDYGVLNAREHIKGEVCDFIRFNGNVNPTGVLVRVTARSAGDKGCFDSSTLHDTLEINCNTLSLTQETPVTLTSTTIGHEPAAYSGYGYVKREKTGSVTRNISLHRTKADAEDEIILRADPESGYIGCGRKAAQNALRFFGIDLTQSEVADEVDGHKIPASDGAIATYPSELREGLEDLFDQERGSGTIRVNRYSGKSQADIVANILEGYPVLALVEGGSHWVTVVGMKRSRFTQNEDEIQFIVHDNARTEVWSWEALSLDFDGRSNLWSSVSKLFGGGTSFLKGTIITFSPAD